MLEAELDRACGVGDREAALRAIRKWERRTEQILAAVAETRNDPRR